VNKAPYFMKQGRVFGRDWFKALALSPGMLFTAAYLMVWLSTNIYLDHAFRAKLAQAFSPEAGSRYRLTIGSLGTGPELSYLTLKQLELVPIDSVGSEPLHSVRIDKLDISCPDIGFLLFRPSWAENTTRVVSRELLCRCHSQEVSMNK